MVKDVFAWVLIYCNHGKFAFQMSFIHFFSKYRLWRGVEPGRVHLNRSPVFCKANKECKSIHTHIPTYGRHTN